MRSLLVAPVLGTLLIASGAFGTELVTANGGLSSSYGSGAMTISSNDCQQCIRDGDANTSFDVTASSLVTEAGNMHASVQAIFPSAAHVDTVSLHLLFEASNTAGSTRLNQGSYELQYRLPGLTYVTLLSDSFGPIGGDSPVSVSYNGTVSGLDLNNVDSLRLLANGNTSTGSGSATFQLRVFQISATGEFVPEPSTACLLFVCVALTSIRRRARK